MQNLFSLPFLLLTTVFISVPFARLQLAELRNFSLRIEFLDTLLTDQQKAEITRGIKMGINMWASVLPDLHVMYTYGPVKKNYVKIIRIGNYKNDRGIPKPHIPFKAPRGCPSTIQWLGCAPRGNIIYINSRYEPGNLVKHESAPLRAPWVDFFNTYSRRDWWSKWQPATYPPIFYRGDGPHNIGHKRGRNLSRADVPHNRRDFVTEVVHEFGHWLGLGHPFYTAEDLITWYGIPYRKGAVQPDKPHIITVDTALFKLFDTVEECGNGVSPNPPCYYYGGADCPLVIDTTCPVPTPEHPVEEWKSDFKWSSLADKYSVMAYTVNKNTHPPGIPHPSTPANMRIIHPRDIRRLAVLNPSFDISYPDISGVIRLQNKETVYLTSNWLAALEKAELFKDEMSDQPFFITGIWSKTSTKVRLTAGVRHVARIRKDGTLWSRGRNKYGELGDGTFSGSQNKMVQEFLKHNDWISIAAGADHTLAIKRDGTLWSWGRNTWGQLGLGDWKNRSFPVQIGKDTDWFTVAGGKQHSIALKKDGTLWTWGRGREYQLGNGKRDNLPGPVQLNQQNEWIAVAAGKGHSLALKADGSLWSWGANSYGQCGVGIKEKYIKSVQRVAHNEPFVAVAAGSCHNAALKDDGSVWCWGYGRNGALGNGNSRDSNVPVRVTGADKVIQLSAGDGYTLAVAADGSVLGWGNYGKSALDKVKEASSRTAVLLGEGDWTCAVKTKLFSLFIRSRQEEYFF
jgi:hypothetical protein